MDPFKQHLENLLKHEYYGNIAFDFHEDPKPKREYEEKRKNLETVYLKVSLFDDFMDVFESFYDGEYQHSGLSSPEKRNIYEINAAFREMRTIHAKYLHEEFMNRKAGRNISKDR